MNIINRAKIYSIKTRKRKDPFNCILAPKHLIVASPKRTQSPIYVLFGIPLIS